LGEALGKALGELVSAGEPVSAMGVSGVVDTVGAVEVGAADAGEAVEVGAADAGEAVESSADAQTGKNPSCVKLHPTMA